MIPAADIERAREAPDWCRQNNSAAMFAAVGHGRRVGDNDRVLPDARAARRGNGGHQDNHAQDGEVVDRGGGEGDAEHALTTGSECIGDDDQMQPAEELSTIASEVLAAYTDYCRDLTDEEIHLLVDLGVPQGALQFDADRRLFKVRAASVVFLGQDSFEFAHLFRGDQQKVAAAIVVCRDEFGDIADLCAWNRRLNVTALWLSRVGLIGEEHALAPRIGDPALHVYPSITEWLAAGRIGVVLIDPRRARSMLHAASPLAVGTLEFGQRLRTALAGLLPRILIEEHIEGAAA